ncbi:hypothetical protein R3P38DRAFT_2511723 [Favolaschia claudopus]|uniref:Zn(2)-C6 fungal-type domain-containing protein n=1 Tax=Favolaschia claudopus TaxID=2862362 RepID=A0AAW0CUP9_9AGAR
MSDSSAPESNVFSLFTKRRRAFLACFNCRRRKVKASCVSEDYKPCTRCTLKGLKCEYHAVPEDYPVSLPGTPAQDLEMLPREGPSSSGWASLPITPPSAGLPFTFENQQNTLPSRPSRRFTIPPPSSAPRYPYQRRDRSHSVSSVSETRRYGRARAASEVDAPRTPIPRLTTPLIPVPAFATSSPDLHTPVVDPDPTPIATRPQPHAGFYPVDTGSIFPPFSEGMPGTFSQPEPQGYNQPHASGQVWDPSL